MIYYSFVKIIKGMLPDTLKKSDINLNNIKMLETAFGFPVGYSDHTTGTEISIAAISLGAKVIEKHFTLDKKMFGWDHHMSITPKELKDICHARDRISDALGSIKRTLSKQELSRRKEYRRSIIIKKDLKKGTVLKDKDVDFRRPGTGIEPFDWGQIKGRKINKDIYEEHILTYKDLY